MNAIDRPRVLLSLQRALLGMITPAMRAIDVCWDDRRIAIRIAVDRADDVDLADHASHLEAEVESDFVQIASANVVVYVIPVGTVIADYIPFPGTQARVFARWEG